MVAVPNYAYREKFVYYGNILRRLMGSNCSRRNLKYANLPLDDILGRLFEILNTFSEKLLFFFLNIIVLANKTLRIFSHGPLFTLGSFAHIIITNSYIDVSKLTGSDVCRDRFLVWFFNLPSYIKTSSAIIGARRSTCPSLKFFRGFYHSPDVDTNLCIFLN